MGEKRNAYRVLVGKTSGKIPCGSLGIDRRRVLKWNVMKEMGGQEGIHEAQDKRQLSGWYECINEASVSIKGGISLLAEDLLVYQGGLFCMKLVG
jgi:hypothetical protein